MAAAEIEIKLSNGAKAGDTLKELTKQANTLNKEIKDLKPGTEAFTAKAKDLDVVNSKISNIKTQIKGTTDASNALKKAWNNLPGAQYFNQVADSFGMLKSGVGGLISQFGVLKTAIAATGIGALLIALVTLVAWFKKTDEGATLLAGIMRGLGVVVDTVFGKLIDGAKALGEFFTGKRSIKQGLKDLVDFIGNNLMNRVKAFLVIWEGISNLDLKKTTDGFIQLTTGVTDATDKMIAFGESVAAAVNEGIDFEKQLDAIADRARELSVINKKNENVVNQLLLMSKNQGLTLKERIDLLDQAGSIELKNHKMQLENAIALENLRKKEIEDNKKRNIETDELEEAYADAQKARLELDGQSIELQQKIANRREILIAQATEAERKAAEEELKIRNNIANLRIEAMDKSLEKEIAQINLATEKKIEALNGSEEQITEQTLLLEEIRNQQVTELREQFAAEQEEKRIAAAETELATLQNDLVQKHLLEQINEQQFAEQTIQNTIDFQARRLEEIRKAHGEESAEYQRARGEYLASQQAQADMAVAIKQQEMKDQMAAMQGSLGTFSDFFSAIAGMQKQGTAQWKAFATTAAILSAIQGAVNAYTSTAAIPVVGGVLAPIAAGLALAAGYANVRKIQQTKVEAPAKKAEKGGLLVGKRHSEGGIHIEAEDGEFVFSRKAVAAIGVDRLSRINNYHTRKFATGGPVSPFASRGPVSRSGISRSLDATTDAKPAWLDEYTAAQDRKIANIRVINVASDTQEVNDKIKMIQNQADV